MDDTLRYRKTNSFSVPGSLPCSTTGMKKINGTVLTNKVKLLKNINFNKPPLPLLILFGTQRLLNLH
jgi:hypothetical protein